MNNSAVDLKKLQSELNKDFFDTEKQDEAKKKEKREHDRYLNDMRAELAKPEGRRVFWAVLEKCQIYANAYVHGDQGLGTTFNVGRQSVGQELIKDLEEARPGVVYQMALEAYSEKQRNAEEE